jgi:carnosine N-methyltransferase
MLRPVPFPDINPNVLLSRNPGADLSMVAGEFLEVYSAARHVGAWDAVVTCFFIDTAPVVFDYIDLIWRILRPGGVWVNLGPLLYHWADQAGEEQAAVAAAAAAAAAAAKSNKKEKKGKGKKAGEVEGGGAATDDLIGGGGGSGGAGGIDERFHRSVELSYEEVRHAVVAKGFELIHEAVHRAPYAGNRLSLMKVVYTGVAFTAMKPK